MNTSDTTAIQNAEQCIQRFTKCKDDTWQSFLETYTQLPQNTAKMNEQFRTFIDVTPSSQNSLNSLEKLPYQALMEYIIHSNKIPNQNIPTPLHLPGRVLQQMPAFGSVSAPNVSAPSFGDGLSSLGNRLASFSFGGNHWWNPFSKSKNGNGGKEGSHDHTSWLNPFRKVLSKKPRLSAKQLPRTKWSRNKDEQYGVQIPENHYEDVPAPQGFYVAPAFVAIQTFLSRNYVLLLMGILLFIATALLIAGIYLNSENAQSVEEQTHGHKYHLFTNTQKAVRVMKQENTKPVAYHEVNPHALDYGMFIDVYPPQANHKAIADRSSYSTKNPSYSIQYV